MHMTRNKENFVLERTRKVENRLLTIYFIIVVVKFKNRLLMSIHVLMAMIIARVY